MNTHDRWSERLPGRLVVAFALAPVGGTDLLWGAGPRYAGPVGSVRGDR